MFPPLNMGKVQMLSLLHGISSNGSRLSNSEWWNVISRRVGGKLALTRSLLIEEMFPFLVVNNC